MKRIMKLTGLALATLVLAGAAVADLHFNGMLSGPGAVRWHAVQMEAGRRYKFEIDPDNHDLRVNFKLYKASPFTLVKEKFGNEDEERLRYRPVVSGTYWLKITSLNTASRYRVEVDED